MDDFLREIHVSIFSEWILLHTYDDFEVTFHRNDEGLEWIRWTNMAIFAQVRFHELSIIEMEITDLTSHQPVFYLHFQMNNMHHAAKLYEEFIESVEQLKNKKVLKVVLSCSGGLTTGYFAMELNEQAAALGLDYTFDAIAYTKLVEVAEQYDVVLLAPQISFMHAQMHSVIPDKPIIDIPARIFAKYDKAGLFQLIKNALEERQNKKLHQLTLKKSIKNDQMILAIALIRHYGELRIGYRLYQNGEVLIDREIIKVRMSLNDITDIIDTLIVRYPEIAKISLSASGIINDGCLTIPEEGFDHTDIVSYYSKKYHRPFILSNDVNAMAVGYYVTQDTYQSLAFLFQPRGQVESGIGMIIDGRLHTGYKNFAGELKFFIKSEKHDFTRLFTTVEGSMALVSKQMIGLSCYVAPELIVFYGELVPDVDALRQVIQKSIPEEYIPDIRKTIHLKDYMLLGSMVLCLEDAAS